MFKYHWLKKHTYIYNYIYHIYLYIIHISLTFKTYNTFQPSPEIIPSTIQALDLDIGAYVQRISEISESAAKEYQIESGLEPWQPWNLFLLVPSGEKLGEVRLRSLGPKRISGFGEETCFRSNFGLEALKTLQSRSCTCLIVCIYIYTIYYYTHITTCFPLCTLRDHIGFDWRLVKSHPVGSRRSVLQLGLV